MKGIHIITNIKSEIAKLIIKMFVVDLIKGLKATTVKRNGNLKLMNIVSYGQVGEEDIVWINKY